MSAGLLWIKYESAPGCEERKSAAARDAVPLIVANHASWLDIPLISSLYTPSYVSKSELRKAPLVGDITAAVGSIFVDRRTEKAVASSNGRGGPTSTELISARLRAKHAHPSCPLRPLCIFPEGTTTNGRYLLPFHTGAFHAGVPVKPVLIRYGRTSKVDLAYETIPIKRHALLVLSSLWHSARVVELPMYLPDVREQADASLYAANVRQYMIDWSVKLGMPLLSSDSTYKTKVAYHQWLREKYGVDSSGSKKAQ